MRVFTCLGLVAAIVACAPAAEAAFPGTNGRIAYDRDQDCFAENISLETVNPDGSSPAGVPNPSAAATSTEPAWSPDGVRLAYNEDYVVTTIKPDGTERHNFLSPSLDQYPSWSPDGTRIVFTGDTGRGDEISFVNADGTGRAGSTVLGLEPAWSPDGSKIAFRGTGPAIDHEIYVMDAGGTTATNITNNPAADESPSWSPDGSRIAFSSNRDGNFEIYTTNPDGSDLVRVTSNSRPDRTPAWSPDGKRVAFERDFRIWTARTDGTDELQVSHGLPQDCERNPDWQPLPVNAYPRPKGASPMYISLVPAFARCTTPDRSHGSPLSFGSCAPPVQSSSELTVGAPDANGKPVKSIGYATLSTRAGNPSTPVDEADVRLGVTVTDVRRMVDLEDYAGSLEARPTLRITDHDNTPNPGGPGAATVTDLPFPFAVQCTVTPSSTVGSSCAVATTADAVLGGAVKEGRRTVWQLGGFEVRDAAGAVFLRQGLFVP
jgi:WD40-like Beta Propeller Repeat